MQIPSSSRSPSGWTFGLLAALLVLVSLAGPADPGDRVGNAEESFRALPLTIATQPGTSDVVLPVNGDVSSAIRRFTGEQRESVRRWLERAGSYLAMVRDVFQRFDLPEDLAFLALVESGFDTRAVSRAGAAGLWQLMASTARLCGLRVDRWVDERFDPEKATVAAARHLRYLYSRFGSWPLAEAAYNAGEAPVTRAIEAMRSRDFWRLAETRRMARETREFVPQVHAAIIIGRDPERYGFAVPEPDRPACGTLHVPPRTSLDALARLTGIAASTLREMNPALLRGVTPPVTPYAIRVPAESLRRVAEVISESPRAEMRRGLARARHRLPPRARVAAARR